MKIRNILTVMTLGVFIISATETVAQDYVRGEIYIKFSPGYEPIGRSDKLSGLPSLDQLLLENGLQARRAAFGILHKADNKGLKRVFSFKLNENANIPALAEKISTIEGVDYAEPIFVRKTDGFSKGQTSGGSNGIQGIPDDPFFTEQWYLFSVYAPAAWDITKGNSSVVIAVVDNGVDWNHPDLLSQIWTNSGEIPNNGVDDDTNGYIDDIRGWDFMGYDSDPDVDGDTAGSDIFHGTHVSGIAGATIDNNIGIAGMAPLCKIMPIKTGMGLSIYYGVEGIVYAYENGAKVINCSWGGASYSQTEYDAIQNACSVGSLVVAAAGNDGMQLMQYPSAFDDVLAVASLGPSNTKSSFSNYNTWVDISAPGESIFSTYVSTSYQPSYAYASGTSMSSPLVAGVAALVYAQNPGWNYQQVMVKLMNSADNIYEVNPGYIGLLGAGKVNAYRAVGELLPGLRLEGFEIDDSQGGNGNGVADPGDTLSIIVTLENAFQDAYDVYGILSTTNPHATILQDSSFFGDVLANSSVDNNDNPYRVRIGTVYEGENINFNLLATTGDGYTFNFSFTIVAIPPYASHTIGKVACTVTNFGAVGYNNYPYSYNAVQIGLGFCYPEDGANALYHGSMMLGTAPNIVCASIYRQISYPFEFEWANDGSITMISPGEIADQETYATYHDYNVFLSTNSTVSVVQKTYAWADDPYADFIIMEFQFTNNGTAIMDSCYAGMFMDWDIEDIYNDFVNYNSLNKVGYMYAPSSNYYGVAALSDLPFVNRAVDNTLYTYGPYGFGDYKQYLFMSGSFGSGSSASGEYSHIVSVGPFDLIPDSVFTIAFALVAGDNLNDLILNAQNAWFLYANMPGSSPNEDVGLAEFSLSTPKPNPFNNEISFSLNVNVGGEAVIKVFDILGREVGKIYDGYLSSGNKDFNWRAGEIPSGVYFLQVQMENKGEIRKILLIK